MADGDPSPPTRTLREERSLSRLRKTISDRLGTSYREAVHVTLHRAFDVEDLLQALNALPEDQELSVTDLLLKCLVNTLERHPEFNATFEDEVHRIYEEKNVCYALDLPRGLMAPVLGDLSDCSLRDIHDRRIDVANRFQEGDFTPDELKGGTFTVSNLGVLGVESFDPVINPPQIAILGVDALQEKYVREDGTEEWRRFLPLDLSFDHRVVDGADAARFLATLGEELGESTRLLP